MRDEFDFDAIRSVEFCVCVKEDDEHENYLVPCDRHVQDALQGMLTTTVEEFDGDEAADAGLRQFEISEKYAAKETLVTDLAGGYDLRSL
jgi:hypothetical protein